MGKIGKDLERVHPLTRAEWRAWLAAHHAASRGVWLVTFKQATGQPRVPYAEAVEEALCFGWIDSVSRALNAERAMLLYTPRQPRGPWSRLNKERVTRLQDQGLLEPAGLQAIAAAQAIGSWHIYDAVEDLREPADLQAALRAEPEAAAHFAAFSPSTRKQLLWWVISAKRPETRAKRITELTAAAAEGRNPLARG